tara:strand:+ start:353575 stop:354066 length:492 start_codon:yes stop_codon:yes gene_type:complete
MATIHDKMENPTLGYVVIAVALAAGMLAASAVGQTPGSTSKKHGPALKTDVDHQIRIDPNAGYPNRKWVLGVRADVTNSGYLIRSVEHSSAARQYGLEPGDRIITVNGVQIGRLGDRVVRIGDQLELAGGHDGNVLLLVQNRRNDQLVPLRVKLRHPTQHLGH